MSFKNNHFLVCRVCFKTDQSVKYNIFETILEWMEINKPNNIKEARRITVTDALNVFLKIDAPEASDYLCEGCVNNLSVSYSFMSLLEDAKHFYETRSKTEDILQVDDRIREHVDQEMSDLEETLEPLEDRLSIPSETESLVLEPISTYESSPTNDCHECQYCVKAFTNRVALESHIKAAHFCTQCCNYFSNQKERNAHIKESHSIIECSYCKKEFTSGLSTLRRHIRTVHRDERVQKTS